MKTVVIGAGITGLTVAHQLKNKVTVFEKNPFIGGLARTEQHKSFKFDLGGHRFLSYDPEVNHFVENLMGDDMIEVGRISKIYKKNRLFYYPLRTEIIRHYHILELAKMLLSYLYRKTRPLPDDSFRNTVVNRFGDKLFEEFFQDYTEKIWGIPCHEVARDFVDARISNISLKRVIKHALFRRQKKVKTFTDKFTYPRDGYGTISERLAQDIDVRLNSAIEAFEVEDNKIKGALVNGEFHPCDHLVSTMPITLLAKMLNAPHQVRDAIQKIKYRDLIVIFITVNAPQLTQCQWVYFPGKEIFGRLHEPKNWSPHLAPENKTGVALELFCTAGDSVWNMPDQEIFEKVKEEFKIIYPVEIEDYKLVRLFHAYPIYDIHFAKHTKIVKDFLSTFSNLHLAGRTGNFRYVNADECIADGLQLAKKIKTLRD